jgi:hypothetical protein
MNRYFHLPEKIQQFGIQGMLVEKKDIGNRFNGAEYLFAVNLKHQGIVFPLDGGI